MMTVSTPQTQCKGVVCLMDANAAITLAAPKSSDPHSQAETGSNPLVAESIPQRRPSRDKDEIRAATDEREASDLVSIEGRLMAKYGQSLGPDAVMSCIAAAVRYFHAAPVRTYVMLLVERRAAAQLREMRSTTFDVNRPNKAPTVAPTSTSPG
jgi:hypothetical protein